jgi:hypothetical protein
MWLLPLTSATVPVAIGSVSKWPVLRDGKLEEHVSLCLTISFKRKIVDGAPAARFTRRFGEIISSGKEIEELSSDFFPFSVCIARGFRKGRIGAAGRRGKKRR